MLCGPRPSARNSIFSIISKRLSGSISILILQNRKLCLREVKKPIKVHMKKKREDLNSGLSVCRRSNAMEPV